MRIYDYLLGQCEEQWKRHASPVVAMDQIAAKSRAERLQCLADAVKEMADSDALAYLCSVRDSQKVNAANSTSLVISLSEVTWFQCIVDGCARELTGWIEVSRHGYDGKRMLNLPCYRRMLADNICASSITRSAGESDTSWSQRRAHWLASYHPDVKVVHAQKRWKDGTISEIPLGSVASFAAQEHLIETGLVSVRAIQMANGAQFEIVDVYSKVEVGGVVGRVRQCAGTPHETDVLKLRDYHLEVIE